MLPSGALSRASAKKNGANAEGVLGCGGVIDTPEIRDFYKRHKE